MEVSVCLGGDEGITVTVADDGPYTPDVLDDLTNRARDTALRLSRDLNRAEEAE